MVLVGLLCAVLAAICNGSFGSLAKLKSCESVHPYIFNFWTCQGIVVSSAALMIAPIPRVFEPFGLLSGLLFSVSTANAFAAISAIGLSIASGIWCGTAVLVSFTYGILIQHERLANLPLALFALVVLVSGISGIAYSSVMSGRESGRPHGNGDEDEESLIPTGDAAGDESRALRRVLGLGYAVCAGCFGGLVLAPMGFAPPSHQGLQYVPSMGLGVLVSAPLVTLVLVKVARLPEMPGLSVPNAALPGLLAGSIWNIGNAGSILAVQDPSVGLAVAYPIMQCGLAVAGLLGIVLFHEIVGRARAVYWASAAVLIAGASLLATSKI